MTSSIICSLYEGRYHLGLAALVNSAYAHGFRGDVCVGYKGDGPPPWALPTTPTGRWATHTPADGLRVHFLRLTTDYHLTNFKPQFLTDLLAEFDPERARRAFYFDPDIVILCPWEYYDAWADCGVALCEDMNSPLPDSNPIRHAWRKELAACGRPAVRPLDTYFNGGFVGVSPAHRAFLSDWEVVQTAIEPRCGSHVKRGPHAATDADRFSRPHPFMFLDQDALNMAAMASRCQPSAASKQGMFFEPGGYLMAHAAKNPKPWDTRFVVETVRKGGRPPAAHKLYFDYLHGPIRPVSGRWCQAKKLDVKLAALLGRLWG